MFTLEEIKAAHRKVKSGADFPAYIQDLKKLGIDHYETYVTDGHTAYFGANNYLISSPTQYETLQVEDTSDRTQFGSDLRAHQGGKTDYHTFCADAARSGIEKWAVILDEMTCTYFDKAGNEILVELIPG